jgi:hypothetical protein
VVSGCVRESGPSGLAERADRAIDSLEETKSATRASGGAPTGSGPTGSEGHGPHGQLTTQNGGTRDPKHVPDDGSLRRVSADSASERKELRSVYRKLGALLS